jgi:hypothetical protein
LVAGQRAFRPVLVGLHGRGQGREQQVRPDIAGQAEGLQPGRAVLAIRWETAGHYGEPFPVLDADLTLIPAGPSAALLELVAIYRADLGEDGPRMGAVVLGGFLDRIAETIARQVPPPARTGPGLRSRPGRLFGPSPRHPPTATVSLWCRPWAAPHLVSPGNPSRAEQKGSDP